MPAPRKPCEKQIKLCTRAVKIAFVVGLAFCQKNAHAGSRTRVTSMGGLYDTATLHALAHHKLERIPKT